MYPERGDIYLTIEATSSYNVCGCESSNAKKTKKNETHYPCTVHKPSSDVVSERETSRKTRETRDVNRKCRCGRDCHITHGRYDVESFELPA